MYFSVDVKERKLVASTDVSTPDHPSSSQSLYHCAIPTPDHKDECTVFISCDRGTEVSCTIAMQVSRDKVNSTKCVLLLF